MDKIDLAVDVTIKLLEYYDKNFYADMRHVLYSRWWLPLGSHYHHSGQSL